jgi:acetyltransferase
MTPMTNLDKVFNASSVAVVGASRDDKKRGYQAIKTLLDGCFEGDIYPVNPRESRVLGLKCYPSISAIEGPVDLALITTPAKTIPELIEECGRKQVAGAVIIAGGFGELGDEGRKLQARLVQAAREANVRLVGPNTSGMISVHNNMNLVGLPDVPRGDIALISQSGNMALALITEAKLKTQKGFSYYFGVGNEADLKFHEYLKFLTEDARTRAIVMYVEGMSDGRGFLQQAYETTAQKPIILLKSGRSIKGARSAGSHTGALAGISEVSRTAFRRAGIATIENSDELFPVAEALASLPPLRNNNIAILADGGGHATIAADVLTEHGVDIPVLSQATQDRLAEILSPNSSLANPIDVAGSTDADPSVFAECARILLEDEQIGGLLLVGLFGGYGIRFSDKLKFIEEDAAHQMGKLVRQTGKPIIVHSLYTFSHPHSLDLLRYYDIPVHDSVDIACKCISSLAQYGQFLNSRVKRHKFVFNWGNKAVDEGRQIIETAYGDARHCLLEHEAKRLFQLHKAPVCADTIASTADEAAALVARMDVPAVMKVVSPQILHKSDAGGVKLGIASPQEARAAFAGICESAKRYNPEADIRGCLVSPMAEKGIEVIIGTKIDPQFGPVIMFGIGGILVEVLKDVVFRVLPITRTAAQMMISEIRSAALLGGYRGEPPVNKEAIVALLLTVSEIIESYPEIHEIDLNPVIVRPGGLSIVDARVILKEPREE